MLELAAAVALALVVAWLALGPVFLAPRPGVEAWEPGESADPLETPRGRAVAALREVEFDRATGKLDDADYAELSQRLTAEALAALREAESEATPVAGATTAADALIASRAAALAAPGACPECGPRPEPDARWCSTCGTALAGAACAACAAPLATGAAYCVACGAAA